MTGKNIIFIRYLSDFRSLSTVNVPSFLNNDVRNLHYLEEYVLMKQSIV